MNAFSEFSKRRLVSFADDIDLEAAVGEGVAASQNDDPLSWLRIEVICNGEWSIGGRH